jgi:hypothetical protein
LVLLPRLWGRKKMKLCKIKGDLTSSVEEEHLTENLLCDFCLLADTKRGEDAQVVSYDDLSPCENIRCEVCNKSCEEEQNEKGSHS